MELPFEDGDAFHDPGMWVVLGALALVGMLMFVGLTVVYYGDSVATPPWNERSVPSPPRY